MRLVRFGEKGLEKPGVSIEGIRYDCSGHFNDWDRSFFTKGGLNELNEIGTEALQTLPKVESDVRWGSPVARPGMILCIGLNYADHAAESGLDIPEEPILFMKATNTLSGPYDSVPIPKNSQKLDWEVELGIVMGKDASYLKTKEEAIDHIAGYTVVHDISERYFQTERGGQWVKGKSCPSFSPLGPLLVTKDEVADVANLNMILSVNGTIMQNGNTKTMIFKPDYIVWYVSQFMQLEAGDIISTGTPPGVGMGKSPQVWIQRGDKVELSIQELGMQRQEFI